MMATRMMEMAAIQPVRLNQGLTVLGVPLLPLISARRYVETASIWEPMNVMTQIHSMEMVATINAMLNMGGPAHPILEESLHAQQTVEMEATLENSVTMVISSMVTGVSPLAKLSPGGFAREEV